MILRPLLPAPPLSPAVAIHLRPYQQAAVAAVHEHVAHGRRRVLLVAATGSGKTACAVHLMQVAAAIGQRSLFVAHRRELINQTYRKLVEDGADPSQLGVIMASDPRRNPGAMVQVASVDTLRFRNKPRADWLFFDEAHRALSPSFKNLAAAYPDAVHIGLTATPYRADGQGLGELYDELVVVASPKELMRQGFLVEPRVFTVPAHALPDLSTVKVRGGDYDERELADAVDRRQLVGNIVEHWRKHADGVRTVVFAVSIAHSKHIVERFQEAGVRAEHLDGGTPMLERDAILARLDRGETQVVGSIGTLCEGTDIPSVKCAILARPTKSTGLYLQQAGRILRPYQGQSAVILDHAGCVLEHGLPQRDREFTLESRKKGTRTREPTEPQAKACPECQCVLAPQARTCPACGHEFAVSVEATLPEETADELEVATDDDVQRAIWNRLCAEQLAKGFKPGWVYYTYRARFGEPPEHFPRPSAAPDRSSPQGLPGKLRHLTSASKGRLSWDAIDQMLGS